MKRSGAISLKTILVVIGALCVLFALLLPARRNAGEAARRMNCQSNLKQIAVALHSYNTEYGAFPPTYTVDDEGNRLHSWRTLILPHLGFSLNELYESIDFTKPWDDPTNAEARDTVVPYYRCPSADPAGGLTTYLGVVGPDCAFSGPESRTLADITDDNHSTLMYVDAPLDRAVHWMSPLDVSEDELLSLSDDSNIQHPGGVNAAFVDGSVRFLYLDFDPDELRAMLTIAGGESVEF